MDGKTTYTVNYGGYLADVSDTSRLGKHPDLIANLGVGYRFSDSMNVYLNGAYENGKYHNKRAVNLGLNIGF